MKFLGVIPARWESTRLEGKVLAMIAGKPMIQHVWERSKQSRVLDDVWIASDDRRIIEAAKGFGAKSVLTSKDHASGTDRITEVVESVDVDIVVNIQGDEPLIQFSVIDELAKCLEQDQQCQVATAAKIIDNDDDITNPNIVKVVLDKNKYALYFSRAGIPFNRRKEKTTYYKHLGLYSFRKDFLLTYKALTSSQLEQVEQLEQLRILESGGRIKVVLTDIEMISVDTEMRESE